MRHSHPRRWTAAGVFAVVAVLAPMTALPSASADDAPPTSDVPVETTTAIPGESLTEATDDPDTVEERAEATDDLLETSAQDGVLYDAAEVESAVVDDVSAAWVESVEVEKVLVSEQEGDTVGLGTVATNDPDEADVALAQMGSVETSGVSGAWGNVDGGTVRVTVDGFKLTSGWERWRVKESKTDREVYYYGHWATAVGRSVTGFDLAPYAIDVRSRPKSGKRSTFLQLRNYWPKSEEPSCTSGSISVSILGFGAGLPLQNCSGLAPDPDSNSITMKVVWSAGHCKDSTTEGADLGMAVDVKPGHNAILSDYSYARFNARSAKCNPSAGDDIRVIYKDPGW